MLNVLKTNILANHPAYPKIFSKYNEILSQEGKINNKKFFEEVILPEIPHYSLKSWYQFLTKFKTEKGLVETKQSRFHEAPATIVENQVAKTMASNQDATAHLIQKTLNISNEAATRIMEHPELMTDNDRKQVELGLKAMKAQDSRIHAIGKIKEDSREEEKLQRLFDNATY